MVRSPRHKINSSRKAKVRRPTTRQSLTLRYGQHPPKSTTYRADKLNHRYQTTTPTESPTENSQSDFSSELETTTLEIVTSRPKSKKSGGKKKKYADSSEESSNESKEDSEESMEDDRSKPRKNKRHRWPSKRQDDDWQSWWNELNFTNLLVFGANFIANMFDLD